MAMNPRLLRPTASGFNPRSISGLALWLDAADPGVLYTTDAGPVTAVSSPLDIAGCQLWLDASDAASITASSGEVTAWADKSATGSSWTRVGGANGPATGTQTMGGKNVVVFDGTNDGLSAVTPLNTSMPLTFFVVQRVVTGTVAGMTYTAGTADNFNFRQAADTNGTLEITAGGVRMQLGGALLSQNTLYSLTVPASTNASLYRDGTVVSISTNAALKPTLTGTHYLGRRVDGFYANVHIAEIVAYSAELSTTDRARVEAYLGAKWSIAGVHAPATASSDPVGYWGDKSGNGRHAVQATEGSRPAISATAQNGRKNLSFAQKHLLGSFSPELASTEYTVAAVVQTNTGALNNQRVFSTAASTGNDFDSGRVIPILNNAQVVGGLSAYANGNVSPVTGFATYGIFTGVLGGGTVRNSINRGRGQSVATTQTTATAKYGVGTDGHHGGTSLFTGSIAELLYYSRALSDSEVSRIETYLSNRWGITLAPQVANADAQNWIDRVYANGGTVSTATAQAVDTFCGAIQAAGIRDRFLRLNLFCGSNLNACLTPLYRSASFGGAPLGNATDDNQGPFISADFLESTGLNGGASNSSKHLRTGLSPNDIGGANLHLALYKGAGTIADPGISRILLAVYDGTHYYAFQLQNSSGQNNESFAGGLVAATKASGNTGNSFHICSRTATTGANALVQYINGVSEASNASTVTTPGGASTFYIFGQNNSGSLTTSTMWRLPLFAYSLGIGMSAGDAAAYNAAMQSFHTAMGRPA